MMKRAKFRTLDLYIKQANPLGDGWGVPNCKGSESPGTMRDTKSRHMTAKTVAACYVQPFISTTGKPLFPSWRRHWLGKSCALPPLPCAIHLPLHTPVDCGVVHLVDQDYQVLDAGRLGQHGVLPCLTALLEARLELAFSRWDDLRAKHKVRNAKKNKIKIEKVNSKEKISPFT